MIVQMNDGDGIALCLESCPYGGCMGSCIRVQDHSGWHVCSSNNAHWWKQFILPTIIVTVDGEIHERRR